MHEIVIAVVRSRSVPVPFSSLLFLVTAEAVTPRDAANVMAVFSLSLSLSLLLLFLSFVSKFWKTPKEKRYKREGGRARLLGPT